MSLVSFATLAQLPQMLAAIAQGRTFRLTKGDLTAEVTSNSGGNVTEKSNTIRLAP